MAKGFASAREAFAEIEARKNSGGGGGLYLKLPNNGDKAVLRFAWVEPNWAWVHALPKTGGAYRTEVCRDQDPENASRTGDPCPGCDKEKSTAETNGWKDREYARRMAGIIPVIWRDAPVYEEDDSGKKDFSKVVGHADQVVKWTFGKTVLEELEGKSATYKDLMSRDFVVTRKGVKLDTSYDIEPVLDDNGDPVRVPLSDNDKKLIEEMQDLTNYFSIPPFESWGKRGGSDSEESGTSAPSADVSPFLAKQRQS
jgi:hypothetical protein